jgi:xanthine/uracil permease
MCDLDERERRERRDLQIRGNLALAGMTGRTILVASGVSFLSGALGNDFATRVFTGGLLRFNDAVTGVVLLAVGLSLLRLAGRAPLWQQVRAMHHWDRSRWISVGVFTIGFLAGLALQFFNPLLALPRWLYYGLSIAISLICIAGISLWPRGQSQPAQS